MTTSHTRPILFSGPMVRALLAGTKTQTRRALRMQPSEEDGDLVCGTYHPTIVRHGGEEPGQETFGAFTGDGRWALRCPYGIAGDLLWVRETARCIAESIHYGKNVGRLDVDYAAGGSRSFDFALDSQSRPRWFPKQNRKTDGTQRWQPSIHLPRWASRITLEITGVRVERLQDIRDADAVAEGIERSGECNWRDYLDHPHNDFTSARRSYRSLWEAINGAGSWGANPWVWVIEFRRA